MIKFIQDELRKPCSTDTQHIVNLSGYQWFRDILAPINDFIIMNNACAISYGTYDLSQYCRKAIGVDISQEAISYAQHNSIGVMDSKLCYLQVY